MNSVNRTEEIARIAAAISNRFHPDRIILFGSHASGTAVSGSDIDLLVVMPVEGSVRKKALAIDRALMDRKVPVDIVVVTPEQFGVGKDTVGSVIRPAVREGKVLYSRDGNQ